MKGLFLVHNVRDPKLCTPFTILNNIVYVYYSILLKYDTVPPFLRRQQCGERNPITMDLYDYRDPVTIGEHRVTKL